MPVIVSMGPWGWGQGRGSAVDRIHSHPERPGAVGGGEAELAAEMHLSGAATRGGFKASGTCHRTSKQGVLSTFEWKWSNTRSPYFKMLFCRRLAVLFIYDILDKLGTCVRCPSPCCDQIPDEDSLKGRTFITHGLREQSIPTAKV